MEPIIDYKKKAVRCILCSNYDSIFSMCSVRKIKLKPKSKRRCENFIIDYKKLDAELNKGNNIKKYKRPDWYFLRGSERKKFLIKQKMDEMLKEEQANDSHPLTGASNSILDSVVSTAVSD